MAQGIVERSEREIEEVLRPVSQRPDGGGRTRRKAREPASAPARSAPALSSSLMPEPAGATSTMITRYLRAARYEKVRETLCRAQPVEGVTEIAAKWGFGHMGRFSIDYRKRFGESPSETLLRSRVTMRAQTERRPGFKIGSTRGAR